MAKLISVNCELDSPYGLNKGVHQIIRAATAPFNVKRSAYSGAYWDSDFFGLNDVPQYSALDLRKQQEILLDLSQSLLEEAFYIEKAGVTFAAKMVLLSQTTSERLLYSCIGAEEASHLITIQNFLIREPQPASTQPFIKFLGELIECGEQPDLQFLIQIVLEGWGLTHYKLLHEHCMHAELKVALHRILQDEGRHHGSGVLLFNKDRLDADQLGYLQSIVEQFFAMVKLGPVSVMAVLEYHLGPFSELERKQILVDIKAERRTAAKLQRLRELVARGGLEQLHN